MTSTYLMDYIKSVDTQLCELINHVVCSVCQELFNSPVSTPCGHSFCAGCIKRVLSIKGNSGCPLCKHSINRYSLETDKAKQIFSQIFKQIPEAFLNDVNHLSSIFNETTTDIVKSSKLFQLSPQKNLINNKNCKYLSKFSSSESSNNEDTESITPVFKHTKNLIKYKTPKEKRKDDFVSISQTEPLPVLNTFESTELRKELSKIDKVLPSQKVKEWFTSVGEHIFHTSHVSSTLVKSERENNEIFSSLQLHGSCQEVSATNNEEKPSTMVRVNYAKATKTDQNIPEKRDPYEFVASLNEKSIKRTQKRANNLMGKIFKYTSTPKSSKRNVVNVGESVMTASQKFTQLLGEDQRNLKSNKSEVHEVFLGAHFSSAQFVDASSNSNIEVNELNDDVQDKSNLCDNEKTSEEQIYSIKDIMNDEERVQDKLNEFRRLRNVSSKELSDMKQCFSRMISLSSSDALELENNMEKYLKRINSDRYRNREDSSVKESDSSKPTPLLAILSEIVNDNLIYADYPEDAPLMGAVGEQRKSHKTKINLTRENTEKVTDQNSNQNQNFSQPVTGFPTQNGYPGDNILNQMITTIEQELRWEENLLSKTISIKRTPGIKHFETNKPFDKINSNVSVNSSKSFNTNSMTFTQKLTIPFLKFGRLTPPAKRRKSSVVKLLFPAGLTSFSKKHRPTSHLQISSPSRPLQPSPHHPRPITISSPIAHTSHCAKTPQQVQTTDHHNREQVTEVAIQTEISSFQEKTSQYLIHHSLDPLQPHSRSTFPHETGITPQQPTNIFPFQNATSTTNIHADDFSTSQKRKRLYHSPLKPHVLNTNKKIKKSQTEQHFDASHLQCIHPASNRNASESPPNLPSSLPSAPAPTNPLLIPNQTVQSPLSSPIKSLQASPAMDGNSIQQIIGTTDPANCDTSYNQNLHIQQREQITNRITQLLDNVQTSLVPPTKQITSTTQDMPNNQHLEKSEDSDSDFFVEQTPPKPNHMRVHDFKRFTTRTDTLTEEHQYEKNNPSNKEPPRGVRETSVRSPEAKHLPFTSNEGDDRRDSLPPEGELRLHPLSEKSHQNYHPKVNQTERSPLEEVPVTSIAPKPWKNFDFAPQKKPNTPNGKKLCIVASSLKNPDTLRKFVSQFKLEYSNKPTKNMTHLVVGLHENEEGQTLPLCTPKFLFAMANKKWVVSETWLEASLAANKLLPEGYFEASDPLGGEACREARLSSDKLFKHFDICLLGTFDNILKEELADIILHSGGTLISTPDGFSYCPTKIRVIIVDKERINMDGKTLEGLHQKYRTVILSRDFLIMSIQSYNLTNFGPYIMHSSSVEDLVTMGYPLRLVGEEDSHPR